MLFVVRFSKCLLELEVFIVIFGVTLCSVSLLIVFGLTMSLLLCACLLLICLVICLWYLSVIFGCVYCFRCLGFAVRID